MRFSLSILFFLLCSNACSSCEEKVEFSKAEKGEDGSKCLFDSDCDGGHCETDFHLGYCSALSCDKGCEGRDAFCHKYLSGKKQCLDGCVSDEECRNRYSCVPVHDNKSACLPKKSEFPKKRDGDSNVAKAALKTYCAKKADGEDNVYEFTFRISENSKAFTITTFVSNGLFTLLELTIDSKPIGLLSNYKHHNQRRTELEIYPEQYGSYGYALFDWTFLVPYAPQFDNFIDSDSDYVLRVRSPLSPPCFFVLESEEKGDLLDVDVYLASTEIYGDRVLKNKDLEEAMNTMKALFKRAGILIGEIRFVDLKKEDRQRYHRLALSNIRALTALGSARNETLDGHLKVDVFLVDDILGSIIGISPSVPGAPGMHGNANNGLVFGLSDLGFDNEAVGYIMAHEISHYLGLRHTTEFVDKRQKELLEKYVGIEDPLIDTPSCISQEFMDERCPDVQNLMFPAIPSQEKREGNLSPMQTQALLRNPLLK